MSAIFGIWNLNGDRINEDNVLMMKDILFPYGKDEQDIYIRDNIALACCLNKISKHSEKDTPVFTDPSKKIVFIADVLIFNRDELLADYKLTVNERISNNELLIAAYEKWGEDFPKYINGDFALAIWDNESLFLARDHLGVRPIYYYHDHSVFVFASDYRAIMALPFIPKNLSEKMICNTILNNNFFSNKYTFFEGIYALPQAHILKVNGNGITMKKYWTPGSGKKINLASEEDYYKTLYDMVLRAIQIRIADTNVKIGAQLSGGLDSGVVDIFANRELKKVNKELDVLFTWAPSYDDYEKQEKDANIFDERVFIEQICSQEDMKCVFFDFADAIKGYDKDQVRAVDAGRLIAQEHEVKYLGSKDIRLMLSGWGGDQSISHNASPFELFVHKEFRQYFKEIGILSKGSAFQYVKKIISSTILSTFRHLGYLSFEKSCYNSIKNNDSYKELKKYAKRRIKYSAIAPVKRIESGEIQTRTEVSAWMGAEYNVQYIYPFLDFHLIDFAMSIPRHMFLKNGINRYIFKRTFEGILPHDLCCYNSKLTDEARCTYIRSNKNFIANIDEYLEKLDKHLFSRYIDFNRAKATTNYLRMHSIVQREHALDKFFEFLYNAQKLLEWAKNKSKDSL